MLTVLGIVLGSGALTALIEWLKDRRVDTATIENLSSQSLREALEAVRGELKEVRADLEDTKKRLAFAVAELERRGEL